MGWQVEHLCFLLSVVPGNVCTLIKKETEELQNGISFFFSQRHIVRSNKNGSEDLSKTGSSSSLSSLLFPCGFAPRPASGQLLRGKKPCSKLFSCTFLQFLYQCRAGAGFCVPHTRCCTPPGQGRKLPLLKVFRFIWCSVFCLFCHRPASKFLAVTSEKKM